MHNSKLLNKSREFTHNGEQKNPETCPGITSKYNNVQQKQKRYVAKITF